MSIFEILQLLGWLAVGLLLIIFALTAGFDFGAGIVLPFMGKNDMERRAIVNTVGPTWDGNQVWLITAGGAIFAIWPRAYAASFSGFYLAFLAVLWALFLRPVSFEYRSKLHSQRWRTFWDWALFCGSIVPVLLMGVAVGNLFVGVPFQFDAASLRFFYGPTMSDAHAFANLLGLLNPFSLFCGIVAVVMMVMHGSAYLALRNEGAIHTRAKIMIRLSALLLIVLFAIGGFWIANISGMHWYASSGSPMLHPLTNNVLVSKGAWLQNYGLHPWMLIAPALGFLGALCAFFLSKKDHSVTTLIATGTSLFGVIATFGLSLFPFIMPSSIKPEQSLLVWNASSSQLSLTGILIAAVVMIPIIFYYTNFVYRKMWGRTKMSVERVQQEQHVLY